MARSASIRAIPIIGVPVSQVSYASMLAWIGEQVANPPAWARSVVLANVHVLTEGHLDPAYREALLDADIVAPDGMPLRWASQLLGSPLEDRCYGPELMLRALDAGRERGWTHFFYGATRATLDGMLEAVQRRYPGCRVAGSAEPPFGPLDDALELASVRRINDSGARLVWVGMGCPKQELWMARYRRQLRASVVLGSGAGFDFLAGGKPQAPAWMQRRGLEWLFRLGSEPRRLWKRYLIRNPLFLILFSQQLLRGGRG